MSDKYAALADTIKIEDITSNEINQEVLRRLKDNDPSFIKLFILNEKLNGYGEYIPIDGEDIGWLGYYIGQNTTLQILFFALGYETIDDKSFYEEMNCNRSIQEIKFYETSLNGRIFQILGSFLKNNDSLNKFSVQSCVTGADCLHQLMALTIGGCSKSLKRIGFTDNHIGDGGIVDIITAMSVHPQLEELTLSEAGIGRNECIALSSLLRSTAQLQKLDLSGNDIDNEGIEVLVSGLGHLNRLQRLSLSVNQSITTKGWKTFSTLLEMPGFNLEELSIHSNGIGDKGIQVFAKALTNNSKLTRLILQTCGITTEGWAPVLRLLCDTSSVNKTYLSNRTLVEVGDNSIIPDDILFYLDLHNAEDKGKVAMFKILQAHSHFNIQPFFEWELKVLPLMIRWFKRARAITYDPFIHGEDINTLQMKINNMKLSVVYDFIKEFPMLYIEPITQKEIIDYTALEEELQGGDQSVEQQQARLEEVRRCKARAMSRLG